MQKFYDQNFVATTSASHDTSCASGKICIRCESRDVRNSPTGVCLHGDEESVRFYSNYEPMTCEQFLSTTIKASNINYCLTNPGVKAHCSNSCQSKSLFRCYS
jgi:hypothetical protein